MNMMPADPKASEFDYKSAARRILPRLAATAAKSDQARRLDDDAAAALRESGLSRILTPKRFGGYETSPSGHIWACAELGTVCSSASWVLMVCVAHDYIVGRFPDECQSEVYEGDADNLLAGCLQPQGTLEQAPGGWRLNGRWQFGSGCDHSPWFIFGAKVSNPGPDGYLVRHIMIPRAEVEFDDTWHTLGMRGSGSKDLVVRDAFIPDHRTIATFPAFIGLSPHAKSPTYRLPVYAGLASMMTASVLGMAERGFQAFVERTRGRKSAYGVSKADSSGMQRRIAESGAELAQARRLLEDICTRFDAAMIADKAPMPDLERIQFRWDAAYIAELCRRSMERIYASAGAHCLYDGDPILVAYRDVVTACHHAVVDFDTVSEMYGRVTLQGSLNENPRAAPFA